MQASVKLNSGKVGPLEFTFFLQKELLAGKNVDPTKITEIGKIVILITPRIRSPENPVYTSNYGVVKCYFWEDIEAFCTFDDTSDLTRT
jgi:hypothetical protein